jgi:hypothetical protein
MFAAEADQHLIGARFVPSSYRMEFPNGSQVEYGHAQDRSDATNYLSAEYDLILFDELVTFEEEMALLIASRARTTKPGVKPMVVCGSNPGGPHARWVADRWVDHSIDPQRYPDYDPRDYCYVPATLDDNAYLDTREYEASLADLPPELRDAYRYGRWDIFPGQYFPEFRRERHVAELHIPANLMRFGALDWGYAQPGVMLFLVCLPDGHLYVEDELRFKTTVAARVAQLIQERTIERGWTLIYTKADPSMWIRSNDTGEAMAETFMRQGVPLQQGNNNRVNGWQRLRHWFQNGGDGTPMLRVHPRCEYLIRTLPMLVSDEARPEDVDTRGEDHAADALRYAVMSRPAPWEHTEQRPFPEDSVGHLFELAKREAARMAWPGS